MNDMRWPSLTGETGGRAEHFVKCSHRHKSCVVVIHRDGVCTTVFDQIFEAKSYMVAVKSFEEVQVSTLG